MINSSTKMRRTNDDDATQIFPTNYTKQNSTGCPAAKVTCLCTIEVFAIIIITIIIIIM